MSNSASFWLALVFVISLLVAIQFFGIADLTIALAYIVG